MSEPSHVVTMTGIGGGRSSFGEGAHIGSISNSKFYDIHGNATITDNSTHTTYINTPIGPNALHILERIKMTLEKLAAIKFRQIHQIVAEERTMGTGAWFKARKEVQDWWDIPNSFLWARGAPGAGKTFMSCGMVGWADELASKSQDMASVCVYLRHDEQLTAWEISTGIITQLVHYSVSLPAVPAMVKELFDQHQRMGSKPSLSELETLMNNILKEFRKASIFVDGLDEMKPEVQTQITRMLVRANAHVLFTSRRLILLEEKAELWRGSVITFIDITAEDSDLDLFIEDAIERTPGFDDLLFAYDIKEEVVKTIKAKAGGMFLHAALHMKALQECFDLHSIRDVLSNFPTGIEDLYDVTVKRIRRLPDRQSSLAIRVLTWVLYAKRPLSMEELQHALSVCPETYHFEPDRKVMGQYLLTTCCGLVSVESKTQEVRLIHFTAQTALSRILPDHGIISRTCLGRLAQCGFQRSLITSREDLESHYQRNSFLEYAHWNGPAHIAEGIRTGQDLDLYSLAEEFASNCIAFPYDPAIDRRSTDVHILSPLHVATLFNMPKLVAHLVTQAGWDVNLRATHRSQKGWTSLMLASAAGLDDALQALLDLPDIDANLADRKGYTPLIGASQRGHENAIKALLLVLSPTDIDRRDHGGRSALNWACHMGHAAIVKLLLAVPGIDVNQGSIYGWTPLMEASSQGYLDIMGILLAVPGIKVNQQDDKGWSALTRASFYGRELVAKTLLDQAGIDVNQGDTQGWSALMHASSRGHGALMKLLIGTPGTNPNHQDHQGSSALTEVARLGHVGPLQILLGAPGIIINQQDKQGQSALICATRDGRDETLKLLLGVQGIDVNHRDRYGQSALTHASALESSATARLLVGVPSVELNFQDEQGQSALILAAHHGRDSTVKLLVDTPGVDVNLQNFQGQSALIRATRLKEDATLKHLLGAPGVIVNHRDNQGYSPLTYAVCNGNQPAVQLLIEFPSVDVNYQDKGGTTPLIHAARLGHEWAVKLLLAVPGIKLHAEYSPLGAAAASGQDRVVNILLGCPEVDVNAQDDHHGCPAWFLAVYSGHPSTVNLLFNHHGNNLNLTSKWGETILVYLLSRPKANKIPATIIHMLLDRPDVQQLAGIPDKHGWTPLILSSKFGDSSVVERLLGLPGVDVNATNTMGESALQLALEWGHHEVGELLRAAGAVTVRRSWHVVGLAQDTMGKFE